MVDQSVHSPDQVSNFSLKISYWYVTHKLQLKKLVTIFLILLSVGFLGYSIFQATMILFVQDQDYRQALALLSTDLIDTNYFHEKNRPQDLELLGFTAIRGVESSYDFVAGVSNPNEKWLAQRVLAQLISGGEVVAQKEFLVYPGEEKYVAFFQQKDVDPNSAMINLAQVNWQRVSDFANFSEPRLNFVVSDVKFEPASQLGLAGNLPISSLTFQIQNSTAYSYWQVGVYMVLLTSQGTVGGVNYYVLDQLRAGEKRPVEMRWYESLPPITETKIIPEVDIYSPASYMPVK